jgi:hypothetical protein
MLNLDKSQVQEMFRLQEEEGIPPEQQKLVFNSNTLLMVFKHWANVGFEKARASNLFFGCNFFFLSFVVLRNVVGKPSRT